MGASENNRLSEVEGRIILRNAGGCVKLFVFVRVRLVAIGCRVEPVENVPKEIGRLLERRGQAFRDSRDVHPETPFAFFAAFAPCGKDGRGLAGDGFRHFAEKVFQLGG